MHRLVCSILAAGVLLAGCGLVSVLPGAIDPACQTHVDPADCQGALDAGTEGLGLDPAIYVIEVQPISCSGGACTTWVSAVPDVDDDCLPSYEAEVMREGSGPWAVTMASHGDPPCAFEP